MSDNPWLLSDPSPEPPTTPGIYLFYGVYDIRRCTPDISPRLEIVRASIGGDGKIHHIGADFFYDLPYTRGLWIPLGDLRAAIVENLGDHLVDEVARIQIPRIFAKRTWTSSIPRSWLIHEVAGFDDPKRVAEATRTVDRALAIGVIVASDPERKDDHSLYSLGQP